MQRILVLEGSCAYVSLVVHPRLVWVKSMIEIVVMLMIGLEQPTIFGVRVGLDITTAIVPKRIFCNWLFLLHEC